MEGVVQWSVLIFIVGTSGAVAYGAVRLVIYALNIRRDIDLRVEKLATKEDLKELADKFEDRWKENDRKFDRLWNESTSRTNDTTRDISDLKVRVAVVENRRAPYNG